MSKGIPFESRDDGCSPVSAARHRSIRCDRALVEQQLQQLLLKMLEHRADASLESMSGPVPLQMSCLEASSSRGNVESLRLRQDKLCLHV